MHVDFPLPFFPEIKVTGEESRDISVGALPYERKF